MYSQKGFKYAIYALSLFLIAIVFAVLTIKLKYDSLSLVLGVLVISFGILGLLGFIASLKGIKEKNTIKKIVGLVINSCLTITILFILIANIYDIYIALN
ncbi:hypothetical protein ACPX19_00665 [Winogradskyella sp. HB-48]|uniref:hypothetical protein n=1 Tax=Winogradskyella sp. HB-48 TaxID=3416808 RepID=UPI003CF5FF02